MNLARLKSLPIAVLLGGNSPERDVSLQSGETVAAALSGLGAAVTCLDPAVPGWWQSLAGNELVFIVLHGSEGEDGVIQGALETMGLRYTGSNVLGSALAMDKLRSKRLWRGIGLPTADFLEVHSGSDWQAVIDALGPVFVKPSSGGSSIATARAESAAELEAAWTAAQGVGGAVIAECLISGPEYTVAILGDEVLPAISMETENTFYDYEAKYLSDATRYLCPCGLSDAEEAELAELAMAAFESLGCAIWGRVDFMRGTDGRFYLLEVNTIPGMTGHSLVPMAARARGIEVDELVGRIACLSLEKN